MAIFSPKYGCIFNIQRYSLHDGPGIRTLVFLKGCPLRCQWCSNPESQHSQSELAYNVNKCIGFERCGRCQQSCRQGAIRQTDDNKIRLERKLCQGCFQCVEACSAKALSTFGTMMSVDEVLTVVEADGLFYARSGGGITLSGGEPLQQGKFAYELLFEAKRRRIKTAMETCGFSEWSEMSKVCTVLDHILFDIKCMDSLKHEKFTGVKNEVILDNFKQLCKQFPALPKLVRTPLIPGFNDKEEDILEIARFIKGKPNVRYELLPYHHFGKSKYEYLGREYPMGCLPQDNLRVAVLQEMVRVLIM
jgi:pyruvate formate lyase activating enzyme